MIEYIAGALTALTSVTLGAILHMKALDRRLMPPPARRPARPQEPIRLMEKQGEKP